MRLNHPSHLSNLPRRTVQTALFLLFIGTITASIGLNLLLALTGIVRAAASGGAGTQSADAINRSGLLLSVILYGILTPLIEELVFRGLFYTGIYSYALHHGKTRPAGVAETPDPCSLRASLIAAIISSLLFGLYHGNLAQGIYAFLMGMIFCLAYERTGQFLSPWILHAACNIISLVLTQAHNGTNAFTQICTWPWTASFLVIAIAAFACLYRIYTPKCH